MALQSLGVHQDASTGEIRGITLILEPEEGGDIEERHPARRVVQQVKTRSGRSWSLREFIEEVLPDLYRAVDLDRADTLYRFVTNADVSGGRLIQELSGALTGRAGGPDPIRLLDDSEVMDIRSRHGAENSFWGGGRYTRRRLFDRIVEFLRTRRPAMDEDPDLTRRKVVHLLVGVEIEPGIDFGAVQRVVDEWLAERIDAIEQLEERRNHLLMDLLRRASAGSASIDPHEFFVTHGLDSAPLGRWDERVRRAAHVLNRTLGHYGFESVHDVRPELAGTLAAQWRKGPPVFLLSGESGQGKTWLAWSILSQLSTQREVALFTEADGNPNLDLNNLARVLWQDVLGHDNPLPFGRQRDRLMQVNPILASRPIYLLVDGVSDAGEAVRLARKPLEEWSLRLLVTCPTEIADDVEQTLGLERCQRFNVPAFSFEQLRQYLLRTVGERWVEIPGDIRDTLRRPLLADLYCRLADKSAWQPTREYELYERFWGRLGSGESSLHLHAMDAVGLGKAAFGVLREEPYPWTTEQLCRECGDDSFVGRLIRRGWLRARPPGRYEIPHDRLLSWAVAQGVVAELENGRLDAGGTVDLLLAIQRPEHARHSLLRYVPMDVLWLLSDPRRGLVTVTAAILEAFEKQ